MRGCKSSSIIIANPMAFIGSAKLTHSSTTIKEMEDKD